jgi:hypothetical protein
MASCSESGFQAGAIGSKSKEAKKKKNSNKENSEKSNGNSVEYNSGSNRPPRITSEPITEHDPGALAEDPKKFDLTNWQQVNWNTSCGDTDPEWVIEPDRAYVKENSEPSALISDIDSVGVQIEGQFSVGANGYDNDFIGIVFGFQDTQHTYVFDWLKEDQGMAPGMCLQAFEFNRPPRGCDLFSEGRSGRVGSEFRVINCANRIPWVAGTEYTYVLNFRPGHIKITIKEGNRVIETIDEKDDAYTTGKFGLYANSQDKASFRTPTIAPVLGENYIYKAKAVDKDDDELTWELIKGPKGMTIDEDSGVLEWSAKSKEPGRHKVTIKVSDPNGGSDEQKYVLEID